MISWMREKLAALPRRAPEPADPPGVTIPAYIPAQLKALSWLATIGVFYMLWLFSVGAARDAAAALHITHAGTWTGDLLFWFPVVAAYLIIAWVVAWTGKVAVPAFVSLRWIGDEKWPKAWMLVIMIAVSAVIIGGSVVVQTETRFEGNREAAVAVEQVQRGRAAIEAERDAAREELNQALSNANAYLNQAANVGAAEWERSYVAQARATNDPRLPQIERALGAARRADELRAEIRRLTTEIAQAPTDASVTQRVATSEADQAMGGFVDWIGAVRAIMLAILQDIACLLLPWIAMRTEQARNRQLATSAEASPASEAVMIEDLREEAPVAAEPMRPAKRRARDGETGDPLTFVEGHWRRTTEPKRAKPRMRKDKDGVEVEAPAGVIRLNGDEIGLAAAAAGVVMAPSMADAMSSPNESDHDPREAAEVRSENEHEQNGHEADSTTDALDEETLNAIAALNADPAPEDEAPVADAAHTLANGEGIIVDEEPEQYGPPAPVRQLEEA